MVDFDQIVDVIHNNPPESGAVALKKTYSLYGGELFSKQLVTTGLQVD
jgi:hypothetical protein